MSIITLSRHVWAGAEEIVEIICREMGYISVDREKIGEAVAESGFQFAIVEKYDEKKPSFWAFLSGEQLRMVRVIQLAICNLARRGNVIIIGRGANILLKGIPGVLRVRIIAPWEVRIRNMVRTGKKEDEIENFLRQRDRDSEGFVRHYYRADLNDPLLYDVTINTEYIPYEEAARMIIEARRAMDVAVDAAKGQYKLFDLSLKLKIELVLTDEIGADLDKIQVDVDHANVVLSGFLADSAMKRNCEAAVSKIEGVKSIENRINIFPAVV